MRALDLSRTFAPPGPGIYLLHVIITASRARLLCVLQTEMVLYFMLLRFTMITICVVVIIVGENTSKVTHLGGRDTRNQS